MDGIILYKKTMKKEIPVVIPRSAAHHVLWKYQIYPLANHPGWKETYWTIQSKYYWRNSKIEKSKYVRNCHICACS